MRTILLLGFGLLAATPSLAAAPAIMLFGKGVQIYACSQAAGAYAWKLKAPDADLLDAHGHLAGHHFAGPSWRALDGSTVIGEKLAESPAPIPGAISWLVLRAKAHTGAGVFAAVTAIVRSQTKGGMPPTAGCDAGHAGAETRTPYSATYMFFPG